MNTIEIFDDYLDELYHTRDLAYDNEDYDTVREINEKLAETMNVENDNDDIDSLDDYDDEDHLIDDDEYIFEEN